MPSFKVCRWRLDEADEVVERHNSILDVGDAEEQVHQDLPHGSEVVILGIAEDG